MATRKNLNSRTYFLRENNTNNPYLNLNGLDDVVGSGFHSFYIVGSRFLEKGSEIEFEIVDSSGNAVDIAAVKAIRRGNARIVSFAIGKDVADGAATLYVSATLDRFLDENGFPISVPNGFIGEPNFLFTYNFTIDKGKINSDDVIFRKQPRVTVTPIIKQVRKVKKLSKTATTGSLGTKLTGSVINVERISDTDYIVEFESNQNIFTGAMRDADIRLISRKYTDSAGNDKTFSYISHSNYPTDDGFNGDINKIFNKKVSEVIFKNPDINVFDAAGQFPFRNTFIPKNQDIIFEVDYTTIPSTIETLTQQGTYADIVIRDMETVSGDAEFLRVYKKSDSEGTNYSLAFEGAINEQRSLLEKTDNFDIGLFNTASKLSEWSASDATNTGDTPSDTTPELVLDDSVLVNGALLTGSNEVFTKEVNGNTLQKPLYSLESNTSFTIYRDVDYTISLNTEVKNVIADDTRLDVYISGSNLPVGCSNRFGTLVHSFRTNADKKWDGDEYNILFNPETTVRNGRLIFVVTSGKWYFADISLKPQILQGFTTGEYRTQIPLTVLRPDQDFDFKFEFFDAAGNKASTVLYEDNVTFQRSNIVIEGFENLITGSIFVGGETGSGIEFGGLFDGGGISSANYAGFTSASQNIGPPGFLIWSGSVLPESGDNYKGVGLELVIDSSSYFRYRTNPAQLTVFTDNFFFGNPNSQFISGSNGNIEISSSLFHLDPSNDILIISGTIQATSGKIGGFEITPHALTGSNFYLSGSATGNDFFISSSNFNVKASGNLTASNAFIEGFISSSAGEIGGWTIEPNRLSDVQGGFGLILSGSANGGEIEMLSASLDVLSIAPNAPLPILTNADAVFSASDTDINFGDVNLSGNTIQSKENSASPGINNFIPEKIASYKFRITGSVSAGSVVDWNATTQGSGSSTNGLWEDINTETGTDADYGTNYTQSINTTGYSSIRLVLSASSNLQDGDDYTATAENIDLIQYKNRTVINSNGIFLAVAPNRYLTLVGGGGGSGGGSTTTSDVTSVFGRVGDVLAQSGDYTFPQIAGLIEYNQLPTGSGQWDADVDINGSLDVTGSVDISNTVTINGTQLFTLGQEQNLSKTANVIFNQTRINDYLNISGSGRIQAADTGSVELVAGDGTNTGVFRVNTLIANTVETVTLDNNNTNQLFVEDQFIVLNSGSTGTPTLDGGIYVERGSSADAYWFWDEGNDQWGQKLALGGTFDRAIFASEIFPNGGSQALSTGSNVEFGNISGSNLWIDNLVTINSVKLFNLGGEQTLSTSSNVQFADISGSNLWIDNLATINGTLLFNLGGEQTLSTSSNVQFADITGSNLLITNNSLFQGTNTYEGILTDDVFFSGFGGTGWRIDTNGAAEFEDLTVRGTFSVYELLVQQIRGTNGSVIIANTGQVSGSSLISGSQYYLTFDTGSSYGHSFRKGDIALAQRLANDNSSIIQSFIEIDKVENAGAVSASLLSGSVPQRGYDYVRLGNTVSGSRQGHIYLTADDTNAPYIGVRDGVDEYTDFTTGTGSIEKVRVGRLDGITSPGYGPLNGFGLWASGSVFLEGGIIATFGSIGGFGINETTISSSNDELILRSNGQITGSNVLFDGGKIGGFTINEDALSGANFYLSGSATGDDFFISSSNWNVKANGNMTGSSVLLDGGVIGGFTLTATEISASNLVLKSNGQLTASDALLSGKITADTGSIGGFIITSTEISASGLTMKSTGQITGSNVFFDGGKIGGFIIETDEIRDTGNNLRLKANGNLTASNARIEGFISSSAGYIGGWNILDNKIQSLTGTDFGIVLSGSVSNQGAEISMFSASLDVLSIGPNAPLPILTNADVVFSASDTDINFGDVNLSGQQTQSLESSASPSISGFIPEKIARYKFRITGSVSAGSVVDWTAITQGSGSSTNNLWEDINTETGTDADYGTSFTQSINTTGYSNIRLVLSASATLEDGDDYTATAENIDMLQYKNRTVINSNGIFLAVAPNRYLTLADGGGGGGTGTTSNVKSVFGRTGNVTAQSGDYTFPQIAGFLEYAQLPTGSGQWDADVDINGSLDLTGSLTINGTPLFNQGGEQTLDTGSNVIFNQITGSNVLVNDSLNVSGSLILTQDFTLDNALLSNQENPDVDSGVETVATITSSFDAVFFDFLIKSGSNLRGGTVYSVHDGTNVEYTEVSTNDLGDTKDVSLIVDLSAGDLRLRASASSNNWDIRSLARGL